jgi:hypothetical protein
MTISDRNFLASQALYGLMIAKNVQLPPLGEFSSEPSSSDNPHWHIALDHLIGLAFLAADKMIARSKKKRRK